MDHRFRILSSALLLTLTGAPAAARSSEVWSERAQKQSFANLPSFENLAADVIPAVVSIQVEQRMRRGSQRNPMHEFFRPWGGDVPKEFNNRGLGTGFVIERDGLILTNNHVIENADHIEVTFLGKNGKEETLEAEVVGTAPNYDVALIKTKTPANAEICFLGDSDRTAIGSWVMAVGNPFGLSHSVSVGIVSAKSRRDIAPSGRRGLYDFIQTDAAINPGNSGGPLVNMRGEVIGINSAVNASGSGIGFAIPINMVKAMLPDLNNKGKYVRSWIGIKIQPMAEGLAKSYGMKEARGALVAEIIPGGPAAKAGIREGDVVLSFGDKPINSSTDLPLYASMAGVGEPVPISLWRGNRKIKKTIVLAAFPDEMTTAVKPGETKTNDLGITVAELTPQLRREYRIDGKHGVLIRDVAPGSAAAVQGIRAGDVVLSLNGTRVVSAREFAKLVRKIKSGGYLRMQIQRPRGKLFLAVRKP